MNKLKAIILYECTTSFKYIWYFYGIQFLIVSLITLIVGISLGNFENIGTNTLEINTLIYVGVIGVLGFSEDFKMLIQNGFTRKYIFVGTFSLFCFIAAIMALVDTVVGNVLHIFYNNFESLYGGIYGYENLFMNWLWLFLIYVSVCSVLYFAKLVINKVGKNTSIYLGVILGGIAMIVLALLQYVVPTEVLQDISTFIMKAMGFMADGTINYFFPVLTLLIVVSLLGIASYNVLRRTELK